jgi:cohesin complex subunit SCC1
LVSDGIFLTVFRSQAAQKFYSLLVLKKFQMLDIEQEQPFAEIVCSRGDAFDDNKAL